MMVIKGATADHNIQFYNLSPMLIFILIVMDSIMWRYQTQALIVICVHLIDVTSTSEKYTSRVPAPPKKIKGILPPS